MYSPAGRTLNLSIDKPLNYKLFGGGAVFYYMTVLQPIQRGSDSPPKEQFVALIWPFSSQSALQKKASIVAMRRSDSPKVTQQVRDRSCFSALVPQLHSPHPYTDITKSKMWCTVAWVVT